MKKISFSMLVILIIIISNGNCYAFRCGNEVIGRFDSYESVINKCGNPSHTHYKTENINGKLQSVQKLQYNCGAQDFIYEVTIFNSIVIKEEPIQRGTGKSECHK